MSEIMERQGWRKDEDRLLTRYYGAEGVSIADIAECLERPQSAVRGRLRELGLLESKKPARRAAGTRRPPATVATKPPERTAAERFDELASVWLMTLDDLAKHLGCSDIDVLKRLRELGRLPVPQAAEEILPTFARAEGTAKIPTLEEFVSDHDRGEQAMDAEQAEAVARRVMLQLYRGSIELARQALERGWSGHVGELLPLIEKLAWKTKLPLPIEDLVQEGAMAAFKALPRFDPTRGVKVETWLAPRIVGAFQDHARKMGRLLKGGERTKRTERVASLDDVAYDNDGRDATFHDLVVGEDTLVAWRRRGGAAWADVLKGFADRERIMVLEYFVEGRTMREIGEGLSLSESRVSQQISSILTRLRDLDAKDGRVRELCA